MWSATAADYAMDQLIIDALEQMKPIISTVECESIRSEQEQDYATAVTISKKHFEAESINCSHAFQGSEVHQRGCFKLSIWGKNQRIEIN
eukprot:7331939-Ditylum_brightwellii.AAC.1